MSIVQFQMLPSPEKKERKSGIRFTCIANTLMEHPGRWARIQRHDKSTQAATAAYKINHGLLAAFRPAGRFEAASRTVKGEYLVFARFVDYEAQAAEVSE
ncbi:hypothetical protein [Streptomyces sp. NPDC051561]|uniref:hypothetical protein n=1 Tax=Streptomyces sp. NPDC051561 TaxID=3365658 RepID=UPI003791E310